VFVLNSNFSEIKRGAEKIVSLEFIRCHTELKNLSLVCISGGFDPIHKGHISYIQEAKKLGDQLLVIVNGDNFLKQKKGASFMTLNERCIILSSIEDIDYVIPFEVENDQTVIEALKVIKPNIFAKGGDRLDKHSIPEWEICNEMGIKIAINVGDEKHFTSSSKYLSNWVNHAEKYS
jgi:D-beta-D-heptose 7-phosphate kinase/D-beta-D-heptose 1-phosphate adenosyltransferase